MEDKAVNPGAQASVPSKAPIGVQFFAAWYRSALALNELAAHMIVALSVVAFIECMNFLVELMTVKQGVIFFKGIQYVELPARLLFDAADIGILLAVLYRGVHVMWHIYRD